MEVHQDFKWRRKQELQFYRMASQESIPLYREHENITDAARIKGHYEELRHLQVHW